MCHINVFIRVVIPIFPQKFWTARPLEQLPVHFVELCCHSGQSEFDMDAIFTDRVWLSENSDKEWQTGTPLRLPRLDKSIMGFNELKLDS